MAAPAWLIARPIAHRGLHDRARGVVENTISARPAAIEQGFAIECDVQLTRDREAVVFHDFALDRLTAGTGRVADRTAAELAALADAGDTPTASRRWPSSSPRSAAACRWCWRSRAPSRATCASRHARRGAEGL